ncbi:MAG: SDR family oxidoreductase [Blastocatellia bacterium]|nr:SDR family oxidoreductase [Blastocatellia bacterium]MCS7158173.1 SDR family oxidoreductase [Blastocatellia bacterium]MCX7752964.1 SDR family oxidoreductase [Blastocatellia bacterium]MDW8168487.1 SDR family oxidoreductase [Acidobacteriota bacterium]MDW8256901.1 SDR family oxidoreductase [Acidobacteriota bacterium]
MAITLTGATGYIGAHVAVLLLERHADSLNVLVRAKGPEEAARRLWQAFQLHVDFPTFYEYLQTRLTLYVGDLTEPRFGLSEAEYRRLVHTTDSIIHCAASLNRRSERSCLNVNLRGTLEVLKLALAARDHHGLRRFSHVSTVAVAGHRKDEVVREDEAIDWNRSDYDPYARTKKFCEHMIRELLPDVPRTIFRPSIVLGDSRYGATTQFDMVRAFVFLANLPVLPFHPDARLDIVPVDFVAESIVALHQKERPRYDTYHLSAGVGSQTFRQLTDALARARKTPRPLYLPWLERPFTATVSWLAERRRTTIGYVASLLKVFMPYLVWNTVFDNTRVVEELGRTPPPFSEYCYPLYVFSTTHRFTYPYQAWPEDVGALPSRALASHLRESERAR